MFFSDRNILFAKELGISRQYANNLVTDGVSVGDGIIELITEKIPSVNPVWLKMGEGEMLKSNIENKGQNINSQLVPLYDVSAAAGYESFDEMISEEKIIDKYLVPNFRDIDWMIFVKGSSMYPKYSSGDIIACRVIRESRFIQWGKVYVVATREQGMLVKRLEKSEMDNCIKAVSDNRTYGSFDIPKDEILGIALVIGVIRME